MKKLILYIYAETPLHVGTGVGLGAVDLPIQREKHTGYPLIQASGVKGALRAAVEPHLEANDVLLVFGGATGSTDEDFAGAISPSDARILLFPVRALTGIYLWITCPMVLERFRQETGVRDAPPTPNSTVQVSNNQLLLNDHIMLEEYVYPAAVTTEAANWATYISESGLVGSASDYWKQRLSTHFVILPDDEFRDFVRYSTDIVTRIHVDDVTKTVKDGQLFSQELLPADTLLYSFVHVTDSRGNSKARYTAEDISSFLQNSVGERLQIGADETVGRGRVRLNWQEVQ